MCRSESRSESTVANNIFRITHCFLCLTALILCRRANIGSVDTYRTPRSRDVSQTRTWCVFIREKLEVVRNCITRCRRKWGERCKCLKRCCVCITFGGITNQYYFSYLSLSSLSVLKVELCFGEVWQAGGREGETGARTHKHTSGNACAARRHDCWERAEHWISFRERSTWNCLTFSCKHVCWLSADTLIM